MHIYSFFLGVYVEKEGDNNINMLNLRLLKNSAAFYSKNSESDQFCLQDGFNYNEIKDCEIEYKVKFQSINDIDTACCLKYKRNLGGGIEYEEKICSFRQNIEICVLEIKQVQKHLINGCLGLKNTLSKEDLDFLSPNLKDIEKELKKEDFYLKETLGVSLPENQIIKICNDQEKNEKKNYKNLEKDLIINPKLFKL